MNGRVLGIVVATLAAWMVAPWMGASLDGPAASFVLVELRVPRVVLGAVVGAALSLTGAAFQVVLDNPLATPSTVGTTAGASLGALVVLVVMPGLALTASAVAVGAFAGAVAVSLGMAALASRADLRTEDLLLAGIAVTLGAGALTTGLQLHADAAATVASVRWALGTLSTVGWDAPARLAPWVALASVGVLSQTRALQALVAGADRAATQGVDVARTRTIVLTSGSLAVAACVATTGPIAFVGLVVPHILRLWIGGAPRRLVPLSAVAGAGFLPLADGLARVVSGARDVPVGVLMAAMGAPALLALLLRRR